MNRDNRRGGLYFQDGQSYLSVTEILKVINKPALMYWFGREVYYAMVKNAGLDERSALAAPYQTSDASKTRGTTVHSIVEAYKTTGEELEGIPPEFHKYATAFYQFMKDHKVEIIEQEKTVFDPINKVAGTLDMYMRIGDRLHVMDVKTGKDIYAEAGLQLSSYANMLRLEGKKVDEISVLLLETGDDGLPTGKYKFQTMVEGFDAFLACKKVYEFINREKLIKLNYLVQP